MQSAQIAREAGATCTRAALTCMRPGARRDRPPGVATKAPASCAVANGNDIAAVPTDALRERAHRFRSSLLGRMRMHGARLEDAPRRVQKCKFATISKAGIDGEHSSSGKQVS